MNATEIAYLEARIEEERYRKVEEAEATYRRDIEALGVVRGLYERYGSVEAHDEVEAASSGEDMTEEAQEEVVRDPVEAFFGPSPQDADPPDAAGAVEEEQRVEAGEPEPEPECLCGDGPLAAVESDPGCGWPFCGRHKFTADERRDLVLCRECSEGYFEAVSEPVVD